MAKEYDAIIIGTGQAGPTLAVRLAGTGMKVAIIERKLFGGTCVNTGCIPTKTLVSSARVAHLVQRGEEFGVTLEGSPAMDMKRVKERKDGVVAKSNQGVEKWLKNTENCTVYEGEGRFEDSHSVRVGSTGGGEDLHQRGRTGICPSFLRHPGGGLPDQLQHHVAGLSPRASGHHRRKLYRSGVWSNVSALWQ